MTILSNYQIRHGGLILLARQRSRWKCCYNDWCWFKREWLINLPSPFAPRIMLWWQIFLLTSVSISGTHFLHMNLCPKYMINVFQPNIHLPILDTWKVENEWWREKRTKKNHVTILLHQHITSKHNLLDHTSPLIILPLAHRETQHHGGCERLEEAQAFY